MSFFMYELIPSILNMSLISSYVIVLVLVVRLLLKKAPKIFPYVLRVAFILSGKDMETSCDEAVMKKMNTDIRADYSEALLKFATGRRVIHATPLAFGEGDTKGRVENVMKYKKPVVWVTALTVITVVFLGMIFLKRMIMMSSS